MLQSYFILRRSSCSFLDQDKFYNNIVILLRKILKFTSQQKIEYKRKDRIRLQNKRKRETIIKKLLFNELYLHQIWYM
ncbi:hypothetical protein pb186bvf_016590 [Paramecium bursaria]